MTKPPDIELTRPDLSDIEISLVVESLVSGRLGGGDRFSELVQTEIKSVLGCEDVILTTSGTDALELAAMLLRVGPGDSVVLPSFTFSSVATAFARTGAMLRFADIESETLGLDPISLEKVITPQVKAVVPVHYGGMACDLEGIQDVLGHYENATLVEDNAHGLFGSYRGRALGTFGQLGITSFHVTKNLVAGEGGALLVNDSSLVERAHVLAEKGTDRRAFLAGTVDKYTWRDIGSSFLLADQLAALLWGQLQRRSEIHGRRSDFYQRYVASLGNETHSGRFRIPKDRDGCDGVRHLFYVLCDSERTRDQALNYLRKNGIGAAFHYVPLHNAPAAAKYEDSPFDCPVTESVSQRLLRLPLHSRMTIEEVDRVCELFLKALGPRG